MPSVVGTVTTSGNAARQTCLLANQASNVTPSASTDGVATYPTKAALTAPGSAGATDFGVCYAGLASREAHICVVPVAGGAPSGIFTVYGWLAAANAGAGAWCKVAALNGGAAITAAYAERVQNLGHFDRIACGITTIGGASTAFDVWVATSPAGCD